MIISLPWISGAAWVQLYGEVALPSRPLTVISQRPRSATSCVVRDRPRCDRTRSEARRPTNEGTPAVLCELRRPPARVARVHGRARWSLETVPRKCPTFRLLTLRPSAELNSSPEVVLGEGAAEAIRGIVEQDAPKWISEKTKTVLGT